MDSINTLTTSSYEIEEMVMAICGSKSANELLDECNGDIAVAAATIQEAWDDVDDDEQLRDQDGDILDYAGYAERFLKRFVEETA
jgi:hypothetical protein